VNPNIQARKSALRRQLRTIVAALTPEDLALQSTSICQKLQSQSLWQQAQSVMLFSPLPREPDVRPLIQQALADGKTVVLPRYLEKQGLYEPAKITDSSRDLTPAAYDVLEPNSACPSFNPKHLDFTLVPGLGFTIDGRRLGRGRGYYDRLLAEVSGRTCGIAFNEQMTVEIPIEPHDKKLSCILTPTSWHSD